jgi:hypothetical protein
MVGTRQDYFRSVLMEREANPVIHKPCRFLREAVAREIS